MSWFRPIVQGEAESAAYWGNPFEQALQGMVGFLAGQQQAAAARAEAERQAIEDERAARELAIKEDEAATKRQAEARLGRRLDFDIQAHRDKLEGDAADAAGKEAALLQLGQQTSMLLEEGRAGNAAAMTQLRLEGVGLTDLQAALDNPGPVSDESIALMVQVRRAAKQDTALTEHDRLNARVVGEAMAEFMRRRLAGEQITLTGPEYLAIREAANARLITSDEAARQAGRPARAGAGAGADAEQTEAEKVAAMMIELALEDPAGPRGIEQRVSSQIEGMAALGIDAPDLPEGSTAAAFLGGGDVRQMERADRIHRLRGIFADLSPQRQAEVALILEAAWASDLFADVTTGFPAGGDPTAVLGP